MIRPTLLVCSALLLSGCGETTTSSNDPPAENGAAANTTLVSLNVPGMT